MEELSIGSLARMAGVRPSTLRYYESIKLLPSPGRVSGRRRYDHTALQRLNVIRLAREAGFSITEIQTLLHGFEPNITPSERWQKLAQEKLVEVDKMIQRAQSMKRLLEEGLRCGCLRFEECNIVAGEGCCND